MVRIDVHAPLAIGTDARAEGGQRGLFAVDEASEPRGGASPESQRMISPASACADMESMRSPRAATG